MAKAAQMLKTKSHPFTRGDPRTVWVTAFKSNIKKRYFSGSEGGCSVRIKVQKILSCEQEGEDRLRGGLWQN